VPLAILLTNIMLVRRTGTEVVTEQLADGLRRRGHEVFVFTPQVGPLGAQMRERGHIVVDRPGALPRRPDIIHAHHTGPAMAALAAHPGVPAVFVSHDATAPFDAAPPHPAIRRVLAVDERCRARLVNGGLPPEAVGLLPNAVDLGRIPPRPGPLPERPRRAVALTKHGAHLPALRAACAAADLSLEEYGSGAGRVTETPEALFAGADLVFATARSAIEAAAAGAGVVVCDARGCAGFLTRARAEAWLPWNLGARVLAQPSDEAAIARAIADWSAAEAAAAAALVRERCGLEALLDRIEALHAGVLAEAGAVEPEAAAAAVGAFLAGWVPNFHEQAPWRDLAAYIGQAPDPAAPLRAELGALAGQVAAMTQAVHEAAISQAAASQAALLAAQQREGALARLSAPLRAAWRTTMPEAIRAPLHRWRTGRRDGAPD